MKECTKRVRGGALPGLDLGSMFDTIKGSAAERRTVKTIFWLSLIGILYTYVGYPVMMWMLARLRPRPWKSGPITPSVSIVLAVHNGVSLLPRKIQHLLDLDYPNVKEIILVSDGSTDGTAELLASLRHPRIKAIVLDEHGGKAVAVNAGRGGSHG